MQILVPIKEHSLRCPAKNYALLPYTAQWLHQCDLASYACVIADSLTLIGLASSLNLATWFETRISDQDELTSCWHYAKIHNLASFFLCPVTQPFRSAALIPRMVEAFNEENTNWDFITTVSPAQNRSSFFVKQTNTGYEFKQEAKNRKGSQCPQEYMIDGTLYLIRTSFMDKVISAKDANEVFWKGAFTCVENEAPFMDVDTIDDMKQFEFLKKYFSQVSSDVVL